MILETSDQWRLPYDGITRREDKHGARNSGSGYTKFTEPCVQRHTTARFLSANFDVGRQERGNDIDDYSVLMYPDYR